MQEESNMFNHEDSLFLFLKDSANVHRCTWSVGHVALRISGSLKHVVLVADICMKKLRAQRKSMSRHGGSR